MMSQLELQVDALERNGSWLIEDNKDDPSYCTDIHHRQTSLKDKHQALQEQLTEKQTERNQLYMNAIDNESKLDELTRWLRKTEHQLDTLSPISVEPYMLQIEVLDQKVLGTAFKHICLFASVLFLGVWNRISRTKARHGSRRAKNNYGRSNSELTLLVLIHFYFHELKSYS